MTKDEALKLALEALEIVNREMLTLRDELAERGGRPSKGYHQLLWDSSHKVYTDTAIPAAEVIREALAQPELTLDGLTPTEFALRELYEFQEATGCDTAAEFKAQSEQPRCDHQESVPMMVCKRCLSLTGVLKQEPVAWMDAHQPWDLYKNKPQLDAVPLYTTPPQRKPLTDEEITRIGAERQGLHQVARAIEAAHGIKE